MLELLRCIFSRCQNEEFLYRNKYTFSITFYTDHPKPEAMTNASLIKFSLSRSIVDMWQLWMWFCSKWSLYQLNCLAQPRSMLFLQPLVNTGQAVQKDHWLKIKLMIFKNVFMLNRWADLPISAMKEETLGFNWDQRFAV